MKFYAFVTALVMVCITVIVLNLPAASLKVGHVEAFGLKADRIELVIGDGNKPEQRSPTPAAGKGKSHQGHIASGASITPTRSAGR
jgi:hypothetical protein